MAKKLISIKKQISRSVREKKHRENQSHYLNVPSVAINNKVYLARDG